VDLRIYIFVVSFLILSFLLISNSSSVNGSGDSRKGLNQSQPEPTIDVDDLELHKIVDGLYFPTSMAFLGPDDILVLQKNNGTINRILNGKILQEPLLDVDVANYVERGMLGIAVDNNNYNLSQYYNRYERIPYVFLYYTEAPAENGSLNKDGKGEDCVLCIPIGHRLYKYELKDNRLTNPQLILNLPSNPGSSGSSHIGGVMVMGPDKNIYLTTGDGESCYNNGCKDGTQNKTIYSQTANVLEGQPPIGRGGIIRVTEDGKSVGSGIIGNAYPSNLYYAYGIRNSFGIDFDPVSGNLWDTENGPGFGDEINLVKPGFNSGWIQVQGIWPINDYSLLDSTPKEKGYFGNVVMDKQDKLVKFDGKGKYSSPELTWNRTEGLTSIKFLNSDRLGNQYENDLFVGDVNGNLYHFDLNADRTELDLKGKLVDKVANSHKELDDVIIGKNFQTIVDIECSPDGYLYILSYGGSIYKLSKPE